MDVVKINSENYGEMNIEIYKIIYEYLNRKDNFTNNEYDELFQLYGEEKVHKVIVSILRTGKDINPSLYKKIISYSTCDNTEYKLLNDVYMKYLYQVICKINQLFIVMGYDNVQFNKKFMAERVKIVNKENIDKENVKIINQLYDEFLILRNVIALANENFVNIIVSKYNSEYVDNEELFQEGYIGLFRAIELYNPYINVTFSTYAGKWISGFIRKKLTKCVFPVYVPHNSVIDYRRYKREVGKFYIEFYREPTHEEMAKRLKLPVDMIIEFAKLNEIAVSIYKSVNNDDTMLQDILSVDYDERAIENNMISDDLKDIFDEVLSDLKDNEKKVIYYRFLFGDKLKFREIGKILGFTKQAAHIHYTKALTKIRDNKDKFIDYL